MGVARGPGPPLRFGVLQLDPATGELLRSGRRVRLQEQPFKILTLLLERPGEVVTRDELRQQLWPADTFVDFDDGLNAAVKKLRFALGDSADNPRFVETIPRRGYRFIAPVTTEGDRGPSPPASESLPALSGPRVSRQVAAGSVAAAVAVVALVAAAALPSKREPLPASSAPPATISSVLVLPLKNLSNDPQQQYFADGMTEELIARLASLGGVRVISRTSAMQYRDTTKLLPQIAAELHVDAIVEGSVLRAGDRVRITAQLVHGPTDSHLWAESYERDERDVLQLQDEVARDIARKVSVRLRPAGQRPARAVAPAAHRAYLMGRHRWHTRRGDELLRAVGDFQRAIEADPEYALAYAGLADCYLVMPFLTGTSQEEAYPRAKQAADRALSLDPGLAEAHNSSAYVKLYMNWDFDGAERGFRTAIDLSPSYATAHQWYAELLSLRGRHEEAIAEMRIALALDPLAAVMHHQAGQTYQQARQYDLAIQEYETAIALDPKFIAASSYFMSQAYRRKGTLRPAAEKMRLAFSGGPRIRKAASELEASAARGDARSYLATELEIAGFLPRPAYYVGLFHAALGNDGEALRWLATAYERRDECVLYVGVDPEWDRLRSDPQFAAIVKKVGVS